MIDLIQFRCKRHGLGIAENEKEFVQGACGN